MTAGVSDALVLHGTPESCRSQVRAYAAAGVKTPVIALLPTPTDAASISEILRRLGPGA